MYDKLVKFIATAPLEFQQRSSEPWSLHYRQGEQTASSKKAVMQILHDSGICDLLKAIGFELAYVHAWEYHIHRKTECCYGDNTPALSLLGYHRDTIHEGWLRLIYNFSNGKENSSRTRNFRGRLSNADWVQTGYARWGLR